MVVTIRFRDILEHKQAFSVQFSDHHSNTGPFANRTHIYHLNTRLVRLLSWLLCSDCDCTYNASSLLWTFSLSFLFIFIQWSLSVSFAAFYFWRHRWWKKKFQWRFNANFLWTGLSFSRSLWGEKNTFRRDTFKRFQKTNDVMERFTHFLFTSSKMEIFCERKV